LWEALSHHEKTAIRKLALGYPDDVPSSVLRRLATLGLVEEGPYPRLTEAGLKLHRSNPRKASGRPKKEA
jgi:hypothetical protein